MARGIETYHSCCQGTFQRQFFLRGIFRSINVNPSPAARDLSPSVLPESITRLWERDAENSQQVPASFLTGTTRTRTRASDCSLIDCSRASAFARWIRRRCFEVLRPSSQCRAPTIAPSPTVTPGYKRSAQIHTRSQSQSADAAAENPLGMMWFRAKMRAMRDRDTRPSVTAR